MPHAIEDEGMPDVDEDTTLRSFLGAGAAFNLENYEFDQTGKDDDAVNFEDLSDDELPDEEEAATHQDDEFPQDDFTQQMAEAASGYAPHVLPTANGFHNEPNSDDRLADDDKDLFGERPSSPEQERHSQQPHAPPAPRPSGLALPRKSSGLALPSYVRKHEPIAVPAPRPQSQHSQDSLSPPSQSFRNGPHALISPASAIDSADEEESEEEDEMVKLQRSLLQDRGKEEPALDSDVFYALFPGYREGQNPKFREIFPQRHATWRGKAPLKPPKPVQPTKLSLDVLPDQERSFRAAASTHLNGQDAAPKFGLVFCGQDARAEDDSDDDLASSVVDENGVIGGVRFHDLTLICEPWDIASAADDSMASPAEDRFLEGEWEAAECARPAKRQKADILDLDASLSMHDPRLSFEDPERAVARLAKDVSLDLNDPNLLIDELPPQPQKSLKLIPGDSRRDRTFTKDLAKRYNISNDEAYDLLKENHQHKIRSTLGSMAIEHSLPATKLQYPFYRTDLEMRAKRAFHRPTLDLRDRPGREYKFSKHKSIKRKERRGREIKELFSTAESLAHNDNASMMLLEYSEEAPLLLSNFGMGNRLINYYRKRNAEDSERPKREIGETQVLLTQDKSPFANFGHVDQGEIVPTLQNGLFRAPVFQHSAKSNDFLVAISTTYDNGVRIYLRNLENLHTVGQQFPLTEVPGEHSRKVTDAAKKRLRALAYRIHTKSLDSSRRDKVLNNAAIMSHLRDQDLGQTRSKMREFMKYEREGHKDGYGVWVPQGPVPDAETLRSWVKPEDVCLLDAMQVGVQHLRDLGVSYGRNVDDDDEEGGNIEAQLAPWQTTKNFLNATQGKAMLKLHGEGDPTGRGEGFSFVKTSMKGGFQALGESIEDRIDAKKRRDTGGHSYNVAKQQKAYDDYIRMIWEKQKHSLTNDTELSDMEMDEDPETEVETAHPFGRAATPRSAVGTPATFSRRGDDESASQFSRGSAGRGGKSLVIKRTGLDHPDARRLVHVDNPEVIALYKKRRVEKRIKEISDDLMDYKPTGDPELDNAKRKKLEAELARVTRNQDRRFAREKAKNRRVDQSVAASPGPNGEASADNTPQKVGKGRTKDGTTSRKCANCGQTGHIKTNRKFVYFCPHCFTENPLKNVDVEKGKEDGGRGGRKGNGGGFSGADLAMSLVAASSSSSFFRSAAPLRL